MRFENPSNGYVEEVSRPFLWTLLFGCFYFAIRGVWSYAIIGFVLAWMTFTLSWFVYPFFAKEIIRKSYLRRGWRELSQK